MDCLAMNFKQLLILHYKPPLSLNDNFFEMAYCLSLKLIWNNKKNGEAGSIEARAHGDKRPQSYIYT